MITGQSKVTGFLLRAGADPSFLDRDGRTAVHLAAALGDETMLRTVLAPLGERHTHLLNVPDHSGTLHAHHQQVIYITDMETHTVSVQNVRMPTQPA